MKVYGANLSPFSRFVEAVAPFFFENIFKRMLGMGEPDLEKLEDLASNVVPGRLDYVESQLPGDGYLFGGIGIADLSLCSPLINAAYGGYAVDADRYPKTVAFVERVKSHPALVPVLEAEARSLKQITG